MPDGQYTLSEFAQKIKKQYPQYANVNDTILVQSIVAKYPQYKTQVNYDFGGSSKPAQQPAIVAPETQQVMQPAESNKVDLRQQLYTSTSNNLDNTLVSKNRTIQNDDAVVRFDEGVKNAVTTTAKARLKAQGKVETPQTLKTEITNTTKDLREGKLAVNKTDNGEVSLATPAGFWDGMAQNTANTLHNLRNLPTLIGLHVQGDNQGLATLAEQMSREKEYINNHPYKSLGSVLNPSPLAAADLMINSYKRDEGEGQLSYNTSLGSLGQTVGGGVTSLAPLLIPGVGEADAATTTLLQQLAANTPRMIAGGAQTYANTVPERFLANYQENIGKGQDREEAARNAASDAEVQGVIPSVVGGAFFSGEFGGGNAASKGFADALGHLIKNGSRFSIAMGAQAGADDLVKQMQGYKANYGEDISSAMRDGFLQTAAMELLPHLFQLPGYAKSQLANYVNKNIEQPVIEAQLKNNPDREKILNNLSVYKGLSEQLSPYVNDEHLPVVAGLASKINSVKADIENLEAQKKIVPEALHPIIDEQITNLNKQTEELNNRISEAQKSDNPISVEADDITGEHLKPLYTEENAVNNESSAGGEENTIASDPKGSDTNQQSTQSAEEAQPANETVNQDSQSAKENVLTANDGQEYANTPRMQKLVERGNNIRNNLPSVEDGYTRLYRGNREGEMGENPSFTSSLEGIALPFEEQYKGGLSYVDVPTKDLLNYSTGSGTTDAEFTLPKEIASSAKQISEPKESGVTVIRPEQNRPNENITTIGEKETAGDAPPTVSEELPTDANVSDEVTPTTESQSIATEDNNVGIRHASTAELRAKYGLEKYERDNATDAELNKAADEAISSGYPIKDLIESMEGGKPASGVENFILKKYIASLSAELEKNPTDAKIAELNRVTKASDKTGSIASEQLRTRKGTLAPDDSLAGFFVEESRLNNDAPLTEKQKETVVKEHQDISQANSAYEERIKELEEANARLTAENEIKKATKGKRQSDTKEKLTQVKKDAIAGAREALKKLRTGESGLSAVPLPGVRELAAIAPHVAKYVKALAQEGIIKLDEIITSAHSEFKDLVDGITEKDIRDIVAGKYNEKRKPRSVLSAQLKDIRDEAGLINKLHALQNGEEPKTEKKKVQRNQQIHELQQKIKNYGKEEAEAKRQIEKDAVEEVKQKQAYEEKIEKVQAQRIAQGEKEAKIRAYEEEKAKKIKALEDERERKRQEREANKKTPEELTLRALKTRNENEAQRLEEQLRTGDFEEGEKPKSILENKELQKKFPDLYKQAIEQKDKLIKLKNERELRLARKELQNRKLSERLLNGAGEVLNVPRSIMSSADFSAPLRQGFWASLSNPSIAGKAFVEQFKMAANKKRFDRWFYDIKESPDYDVSQKAGLYLADPHNVRATVREEQFMSNLAEKIPLLGKVVAGSERAYVGYLNKLRWDLWNSYVDNLQSQGKTYENSKAAYDGLAAYINDATGRGNITNNSFQQAAPLLNSVFFSPRLIASRINLLTRMATIWKPSTPKEVRVMYLKDFAKVIGVGLTTMALAKLAGADVQGDPRSSDFGKIKSGDTRLDVWGGFLPYIRYTAQILSGQTVNQDGTVTELGKNKQFGRTRADVATAFFRGKLAPIPGSAWDLASGRDVVGNEVTVGSTLKRNLLPLITSDFGDAYKDAGFAGVAKVIPSIFGVGVSTYVPKAKTSRSSSRSTSRNASRSTSRSAER